MASLSWDSELMTNYVPAVAVPAGSHMAAGFDAQTQQPFLVALSDHDTPRLQIIRVNQQGQRTLTNLGDLIGIPASTVIQAFDVRQAQNQDLHLVVATKLDDRNSSLWVSKPFQLSDSLSLSMYPNTSIGGVHDISIGPVIEGSERYPAIYIQHQPLDRTAKGTDLARVEVIENEDKVVVWKDLTLPENAQKILSITPVSMGTLGQGLAFLTDLNGKRMINVKVVRPASNPNEVGKWAQFQLPCPSGAESLASFTDPKDNLQRTSILVGADAGIYVFGGSTIAFGEPAKLLVSDSSVEKAKNLHVRQDKNVLSIWTINKNEELAYVVLDLGASKVISSAILLSEGSATSFAPAVQAADELQPCRQILVTNDTSGDLTMLEQSLDTGIWREEPFYVESASDCMSLQSYTINMTFMSEGFPLCGGSAFIRTPSLLTTIVNGRLRRFSPEGKWYPIDATGEICIIVAANGLVSQPFTIEKVRSADEKAVDFASQIVDPANKAINRMSSLASVDALKNAKTADGKSLWTGMSVPSDDDLKAAAECLGAIKDAHQALPDDGSGKKMSSESEQYAASQLVEAHTTQDLLADMFHFLKQKTTEARDWIVKKAGDAWEFICEIGGKIWSIVLDCVEKVTEAATWVWKKLKVGWQKLTDLVGFIFNWSDIRETRTTIKNILNSGLEFVADKVEGINDKVESFFEMMKGDVRGSLDNIKFPPKLNEAKKANGDKKTDEFKDSTAVKWVGERMKNGGLGSAGGQAKVPDAEMVNFWDDRIKPLTESLETLAKTLGTDIVNLFRDGEMSQVELILKLRSNFMVGLIDIVKQVVKTLVTLISKLVIFIKDVGNSELPKVTGMSRRFYNFVSDEEPTIFDIICLLIAVPATLITKIVTGKKPPTFPDMSKQFFHSFMAGPSDGSSSKSSIVTLSKETRKDFDTFMLGCGCGAAVVGLAIKNMIFLLKIVLGGYDYAFGSLSPGTVMRIFSMVVDGFAMYKTIAVLNEPGIPRADLRKTALWIKGIRILCSGVYIATKQTGKEDPISDQIILCIELLCTMSNFGLYSAVYIAELEDKNWKGRDEALTLANGTDNFLEAIAGIGQFVSLTFKATIPPLTVAGLGALQVAGVGSIVAKSMHFNLKYKKPQS